MRFITYLPLNGVVASTDQTSAPIDISSCMTIGLHAHVLTGDAKGKCYVQVSLDPPNTTPTDWNSLPNHADLTGSATTAYAFNEVCANWARVYWDHSGGSTGTMKAHIKTNGY